MGPPNPRDIKTNTTGGSTAMVSKTQTFTKGAAWVGLLGLVLSGPAAAATQYPSGYATSGLAQLAEVLSERGWHTRPGEDGSLLFATAASGFTTPQTLAMTSATARSQRPRRADPPTPGRANVTMPMGLEPPAWPRPRRKAG